MKKIQERGEVQVIKWDLRERVEVLFNWTVEIGKTLPRVMSGLVIAESMRVVSAGGFYHKSSVGEVEVFMGCGILGLGWLLAILGGVFGGCDCGRYDYVDAGAIQSGSRWRYSLHLMIIGDLCKSHFLKHNIV